MKPKILLLDIDGVLVQPAGYRLATEATCQYFLKKGGIKTPVSYPEIYSLFEAQRVTSEWDMVPLALLMVFNAISEFNPIPSKVDSLEKFLSWTKQKSLPKITTQIEAEILQLGQYIHPGMTAAQCVLEAKLNGHANDIFKNLDNPLLLSELLSNTRNILGCETTRKFQEFALGGEIFKHTYNREPEQWLPSFLLTYDRSLLSKEYQGQLLDRIDKGDLYACVYTARPSLPPKEYLADRESFSPEAELAMKLCHLESLPMIGYGKLGYLASKTGRTIPEYIKPAPVQALAAIASAWTGNEWLGLEWAARFSTGGFDMNRTVIIPNVFELYVFEDSASGIQGGRKATELLHQNGWKVEFHPIGISAHPEKRKALIQSGAKIYLDVNFALEAIL